MLGGGGVLIMFVLDGAKESQSGRGSKVWCV